MESHLPAHRNAIFIFMLLSLAAFSGLAQAPLIKQWDRKFGGANFEILHSFQKSTDGGYTLFGYSESDSTGLVSHHNRGYSDFWLVKTDSNGVKQWDQLYGGSNIDVGIYHIQTTDNGYLLGGYSMSDTSGDKTALNKGYTDFWLVKTDASGMKIWDKTYGGTGLDVYTLAYMDQTNDGGYIIGGTASGGVAGDNTHPNRDSTNNTYDYWIIRIDPYGNKLWDQRFGGTANDFLYSVIQTPDGGFLLTGTTESLMGADITQPSQGAYDLWVVKTDVAGNKLWDRRYGGSGYDYMGGIAILPDGKIILGAQSNSPVSGDKSEPLVGMDDIWILKTDASGNILWDKDFGGFNTEEIQNIVTDNFGNIFLSTDSYSNAGGDKSENNLGYEQSWIVKLDISGNIIWDKTILTTGHDETTRAVSDGSGCLVVANFSDGTIGGYNTHQPYGLIDFWMVKFCDSTFVSGTVEPIMNTSMYPNPFSETIIIETEVISDQFTVLVTDISGRIIYADGFKGKTAIPTEKWPKGFYIISVEGSSDTKSVLRKLFVKT